MGSIFGLVAGIIGIVGYIPYARDVINGATQPDRMAWFIWLLEYSALLLAQIMKGATDSLWLIGLQLCGVAVIFGLSLKYGVGGVTRYNVTLLIGVVVILCVWKVVGDATLAIILLLAVEVSGVLLTVRKVYMRPQSETLLMWWLVCVAGGLGTLAVGNASSYTLYLYPVALMAMGASVVSAAYAGGAKCTMRRCKCVWRAEY